MALAQCAATGSQQLQSFSPLTISARSAASNGVQAVALPPRTLRHVSKTLSLSATITPKSKARYSVTASASGFGNTFHPVPETGASPPPVNVPVILAAAMAAVAATAAAVARVVLQPLRDLFAPLTSAEARQLDVLYGRDDSRGSGIGGRILACAAPLFFAAIGQSGGMTGSSTSTPLTVVASGMAKWLELYSGLLLVRVLLSWFPNIDWERQPMQAIRDMSDPYLNLFRNILPPFFGALDLSPMLAFLVLGMLTSLLNTTVFT